MITVGKKRVTPVENIASNGARDLFVRRIGELKSTPAKPLTCRSMKPGAMTRPRRLVAEPGSTCWITESNQFRSVARYRVSPLHFIVELVFAQHTHNRRLAKCAKARGKQLLKSAESLWLIRPRSGTNVKDFCAESGLCVSLGGGGHGSGSRAEVFPPIVAPSTDLRAGRPLRHAFACALPNFACTRALFTRADRTGVSQPKRSGFLPSTIAEEFPLQLFRDGAALSLRRS